MRSIVASTNNAYTVTKDPPGCQDVGAKIWCCISVEPRKDIQIAPEKLNQVQSIFLIPNLAKFIS